MLFDNDLNTMLNYLAKYCLPEKLAILEECSDEDVNYLYDLVTLSNAIGCDIYATGGKSNTRFLGIGVKPLTANRAPSGNLFVKITSNGLYLAESNEECADSNRLSSSHIIHGLLYLSQQKGSGFLPADYAPA